MGEAEYMKGRGIQHEDENEGSGQIILALLRNLYLEVIRFLGGTSLLHLGTLLDVSLGTK